MQDYLSVIRSVDRNIGRVLDYLIESGLWENTLVIYTSDQGFYMGEHGWFDKRFMYEESFRTPLLAHLPGGYHGEVDALVQNIDHAPPSSRLPECRYRTTSRATPTSPT
ncbi:sulfatase [Alistipes sp. CAG:831]|nr:sulfatase [Alistipes sp. CAG:831]